MIKTRQAYAAALSTLQLLIVITYLIVKIIIFIVKTVRKHNANRHEEELELMESCLASGKVKSRSAAKHRTGEEGSPPPALPSCRQSHPDCTKISDSSILSSESPPIPSSDSMDMTIGLATETGRATAFASSSSSENLPLSDPTLTSDSSRPITPQPQGGGQIKKWRHKPRVPRVPAAPGGSPGRPPGQRTL